ncbi:PepSY domain-containing protein [Mangrovitalea sediminis]|uniref:PepSY domain-containing protein n=1 Tax=Mangrovitalea sediminis TaxID=1982043 RepID=UPI000BE53A64|nr:PepSY domain-containing protein [Mangrovitalea sediminis]
MTKTQLRHAALAILLFGSLSPSAFAALTGSARYSHSATVSLTQARAIATHAYSGKILKEELEKEEGGSGLRYSFDIRQGNITHEVGVDAKTGKVLENASEAVDND